MESLQLSFKSLPGVSSDITVVLGSTADPKKECKIIPIAEYNRYQRNNKKLKKYRRLKRQDSEYKKIELEEEDLKPMIDLVDHSNDELAKSNVLTRTKSRSKETANELAEHIEDGIKKFGSRSRLAMQYGYDKLEGKETETTQPIDPGSYM